MADEQDDPPAPPPKPPPRRRRPTPTIELKATEVAVEPTASTASADPAPPQNAASSDEQKPAAARTAKARSPIKLKIPPSSTGADAPPQEPPAAPPGQQEPGRPINWALLRAAGAGVLAAFLVFVGFWLAGLLSQDNRGSAALSERLALAETRLRELSSRPAPAGLDTRPIDELTARLGKLEASITAPRAATGDPAIASRLAAIEETIKSLQGNVADLARRMDDNASATREARGRADASLLAADAARSAVERSNIDALGNRIAALERATKTLPDDVAKSATAAADRPLRLAVSAQALRNAVERGDPFTAELAAVKPLATDPQALAPMEAFATAGVPTQAALARQLSELTPAMLRLADAPATADGFLDRLQAHAQRLVRVRPIDETPGDDAVAIIGRAEAKVARSDIPGALAELAKLPAPVRAPAEEWIKKAEARNAAVAVSRRLASDALAALGRSP